MADLAARVPNIAAENRALLETGAGILGVAFLIKAGTWPLCFWLPETYTVAAPPVAAIFAIMTKVGAYIVLRLSLLVFAEGAGASARFRCGLGAAGRHSYRGVRPHRDAGVSGFGAARRVFRARLVRHRAGRDRNGEAGVIGGALFYLVSSTLGLSAFFLLVELVERGREPSQEALAAAREAFGDWDLDQAFDADEEVGIAIPATMAHLGSHVHRLRLVLAGLPPLSGFVGKFVLLTAALNPSGIARGGGSVPAASWALLALLLLSGLAAIIAMTRTGIRAFWALARPLRAARARDRDRASNRSSPPMRNSDRPGRTDHAVHAGHGRIASRAA